MEPPACEQTAHLLLWPPLPRPPPPLPLSLQAIEKAREKVAASEAALAGLPPVPDNMGRIGDLMRENKGLQDQVGGSRD